MKFYLKLKEFLESKRITKPGKLVSFAESQAMAYVRLDTNEIVSKSIHSLDGDAEEHAGNWANKLGCDVAIVTVVTEIKVPRIVHPD